jgi:multidrug efflux pump subunit AcrA (membrane-fusion protein)
MISKTYVNEIDISKVKIGQPVEVGVDAFPDKKFTGSVVEVANIGEQIRNSNAKVFEVKIEINEYDSILRPAMTTKNTIITAVIDSVFFVPIECVHSNDSLIFVYTDKRTRQQVITGESNENEIIIRAGVRENEQLYLVPPENSENFTLVSLDPNIVDRFKKEDNRSRKPVMNGQTKRIMEKHPGAEIDAGKIKVH